MKNLTIIGEKGEAISKEYLIEIFMTSNNAESFLRNVNYGITDEENFVSNENNENILSFYKECEFMFN